MSQPLLPDASGAKNSYGGSSSALGSFTAAAPTPREFVVRQMPTDRTARRHRRGAPPTAPSGEFDDNAIGAALAALGDYGFGIPSFYFGGAPADVGLPPPPRPTTDAAAAALMLARLPAPCVIAAAAAAAAPHAAAAAAPLTAPLAAPLAAPQQPLPPRASSSSGVGGKRPREFACPHCGQQLATTRNLEKHVAKKHGGA